MRISLPSLFGSAPDVPFDDPTAVSSFMPAGQHLLGQVLARFHAVAAIHLRCGSGRLTFRSTLGRCGRVGPGPPKRGSWNVAAFAHQHQDTRRIAP